MPGRGEAPLVTALLTNWNYGRFLREAIDSALGQTYPRVEVIVVDDGSSDDSRQILAGYGERVRAILKPHGGHVSAVNAGVAAARGEIVCFLDADDAWLPEKVARVVAAFEQEGAGLVCHDLRLQGSAGVVARGRTWCEAFSVTLRGGDLLPRLRETAFEWVFSPTSGLSVAAELLRRMGPLPEEWNDGPDSAIASVAACLAPVAVLDEPLGVYRLHGGNKAAVAQPSPWFFLHENLSKRPRRVAYARHVLARLGVDLQVDPLDHYPFLRDWCFVTQPLPVACLPRLLRVGLAFHRRAGLSARALLSVLARDVRKALLISLGREPRFREYRRLWRAATGETSTPWPRPGSG